MFSLLHLHFHLNIATVGDLHGVHRDVGRLAFHGLANKREGGKSRAPLTHRLAGGEFECRLVRGTNDAPVVAHLRGEQRGLALHGEAEVGALVGDGVNVIHELLRRVGE